MTFNTRVEASHYLEDQYQWRVELDNGETINARFVIMPPPFVQTNFPNITGLDRPGSRLPHRQLAP